MDIASSKARRISSGKKINGLPFRKICDDYKVNSDPMRDNHKAIQILNTFDRSDQNLLILYAETGSLREVSEIIGVSERSMYRKLTPLREEFKRRFLSWLN